MRWIELVRCLFDSLMVLWFFRPLAAEKQRSDIQKVLCFLILLFAAPIYPTSGGGILITLWRFVYRAAVFAVWLFARKGLKINACAYYALLCWIAFTTENNIFLTPQLSFLRWNRINFSSVEFINQAISLVIELIAEFIILTIISRSFPFEYKDPNWRIRFISIAIVIICQLYVKSSLKAISDAMPEHYMSELTLFPILLQILLTAALILLEKHLFARRNLEKARLDEVAARYRYETAQAKNKAGSDIRQLHHDMKNHLLGIKRLSGDNEKLDSYISQLLQRTDDYELLVDTGNTMIDGLLSEKMRKAASENIEISAAVDLHDAKGISDMDLCTIFGNALDNAIEASTRVENKDLRSIMVRCRMQGGSLLLSVQNYFEGEISRSGNDILSSKKEPGHGLGLSSIRSAAEKNGGTMTTATDEYHNFILTVLI